MDNLGKKILDPNAGYSFSHHQDPNLVDEGNYGGAGIDYPEGNDVLEVHAHHNGKVVGRALFEPRAAKRLKPLGVFVNEEHRRRGVGSALYHHAEKVYGYQVVPADTQTDAGRALWRGNRKVKQFGKSELEKMAIADLGTGKKTSKFSRSYSHLLSPEHVLKGYSIKVHEIPNDYNDDDKSAQLQAELIHKDGHGQPVAVGLVGGETDPAVGRVQLHSSHIQEAHRGKGLGVPLYEAFYAHAKNKMGMTHVIGETHSTMASKVHQKLAEKHGLGYVPSKNTDPKPGRIGGRPYDNAYNPYEYELKYESALMYEDLNKMALGDIPVGPRTGDVR